MAALLQALPRPLGAGIILVFATLLGPLLALPELLAVFGAEIDAWPCAVALLTRGTMMKMNARMIVASVVMIMVATVSGPPYVLAGVLTCAMPVGLGVMWCPLATSSGHLGMFLMAMGAVRLQQVRRIRRTVWVNLSVALQWPLGPPLSFSMSICLMLVGILGWLTGGRW